MDDTTHLMIKVDNGIKSLKPEKDWQLFKNEFTLGNSCALNSIYNGVERTFSRSLTPY